MKYAAKRAGDVQHVIHRYEGNNGKKTSDMQFHNTKKVIFITF